MNIDNSIKVTSSLSKIQNYFNDKGYFSDVVYNAEEHSFLAGIIFKDYLPERYVNRDKVLRIISKLKTDLKIKNFNHFIYSQKCLLLQADEVIK